MIQCKLDSSIQSFFSADAPLFDQVMALRGERFRELEGRLTQRIQLGEKYYFIKQYRGVGWKEIIKNCLQLRWPVLGAKGEWRAIQKLQHLGVSVPRVVGFGQRGYNPARLQSFLIMEEIAPSKSLETLGIEWQQTPPTFVFKQWLIQRVAAIARLLHENGINHRDFYICHFLLDGASAAPHLHLIDLHRAQMRSKVPLRWIIKDLAGLFYSTQSIGLTKRDYFRFVQTYSGQPLRIILHSQNKFWQKIAARGANIK